MKLIYGGPSDEVEVPDAGVLARRGEAVEVPDEMAARLLEQDIWQRAAATKTAPKVAGGEG